MTHSCLPSDTFEPYPIMWHYLIWLNSCQIASLAEHCFQQLYLSTSGPFASPSLSSNATFLFRVQARTQPHCGSSRQDGRLVWIRLHLSWPYVFFLFNVLFLRPLGYCPKRLCLWVYGILWEYSVDCEYSHISRISAPDWVHFGNRW